MDGDIHLIRLYNLESCLGTYTDEEVQRMILELIRRREEELPTKGAKSATQNAPHRNP